MLIDTHAHLNFVAYNKDREEVIKRTMEAGVGVINVGTQKQTSRTALDLAKEHSNMWATVGLHPIHTTASLHDREEIDFRPKTEVFDMEYYQNLAQNSEVVAIGECGLDYFHSDDKKEQRKAFESQIELAKKLDKPLMLHLDCRISGHRLIMEPRLILRGNIKLRIRAW